MASGRGYAVCNRLKGADGQLFEGFDFMLGSKVIILTLRLTGHHGVALVRRQIPSNGGAGCGEAGLGLVEAAIDEGQRVQSLGMMNRD